MGRSQGQGLRVFARAGIRAWGFRARVLGRGVQGLGFKVEFSSD